MDRSEILLQWNEEQKYWEERKEPYAVIECPTREDYEDLKESVLIASALKHPKTNADRIRSMSDEALADFLCELAYTGKEPWSEPFSIALCHKCPTVKGRYCDTGQSGEWHECEFDDGKCPHGSDVMWWLRKEAQNGDH